MQNFTYFRYFPCVHKDNHTELTAPFISERYTQGFEIQNIVYKDKIVNNINYLMVYTRPPMQNCKRYQQQCTVYNVCIVYVDKNAVKTALQIITVYGKQLPRTI